MVHKIKSNDTLVQFRAPSELRERVKQAASTHRLTASELWRRGIELYLEQLKSAIVVVVKQAK